PAQQLACARTWIRDGKVKPIAREWDRTRPSNERIRVAYVSADFHRHVTANVMAELFEVHDRNRLEVIGISLGHVDRTEMRARLVKACDRFFDVSSRTDAEAAKLMRDLGTHIAVDLKGHTRDARIGILAQRAAPIQISYMGFPATVGADFIDYVIADQVVLPLDQQPFFMERIVHLPDSYYVRDCTQKLAPTIPSRRA